MNISPLSVIMLGATGAVGSQVVQTLIQFPEIDRLTLLGRRPIPNITNDFVYQHKVDIFDPSSYSEVLPGHHTAICTLGVGAPSKVSKSDFIKIDKLAVLDFAKACKKAGIDHFELLASVGIDAKSRSFYLRTKGELVHELATLNFERLSIFEPSMILTPVNRYGFSQAILLRVWPLLKPLLFANLRKYRGVPVAELGRAMAANLLEAKSGQEILRWGEFQMLNKTLKDRNL